MPGRAVKDGRSRGSLDAEYTVCLVSAHFSDDARTTASSHAERFLLIGLVLS